MYELTLKLKNDIQSLFLAFNPNKCTVVLHILQSFGVFTGNRCLIIHITKGGCFNHNTDKKLGLQ